MRLSVRSIDQTTLPAAMLDMTKKHLRIDFTDDDASITDYLAWTIGYIEHFTGLRIFGTSVDFLPVGGYSRTLCPVRPVSSFTAADASGDVTADYFLESGNLTEPVWIERIDGDLIPAGVTFTLVTGYQDPATMDPALRGNITRAAATMYEHRESITAYSLDQVPFWMNDMLGGLWVPRA